MSADYNRWQADMNLRYPGNGQISHKRRFLEYQYYRFIPTEIRGGGRDWSVQFTQLQIKHANGEEASTQTWCDSARGHHVLNCGKKVMMEAYTWKTGSDCEHRDPISWRLEASNDQAEWVLLDVQTRCQVPRQRSKVLPYFIPKKRLPLHSECSVPLTNRQLEKIRQLCDQHRGDINLHDEMGQTPLAILLCSRENRHPDIAVSLLEAAKVLVNYGADINFGIIHGEYTTTGGDENYSTLMEKICELYTETENPVHLELLLFFIKTRPHAKAWAKFYLDEICKLRSFDLLPGYVSELIGANIIALFKRNHNDYRLLAHLTSVGGLIQRDASLSVESLLSEITGDVLQYITNTAIVVAHGPHDKQIAKSEQQRIKKLHGNDIQVMIYLSHIDHLIEQIRSKVKLSTIPYGQIQDFLLLQMTLAISEARGDEGLEGFVLFSAYFPLRVWTILHTLITQKLYGSLSEQDENNLKKEVMWLVEAHYAHVGKVFEHALPAWQYHQDRVFNACADNMYQQIRNLQNGEDYYYATGFRGHAMYVTFSLVNPTTAQMRIDNLGGGADRHAFPEEVTPEKIEKRRRKGFPPRSPTEYRYPYVVQVSLNNENVTKGHLAKVIESDFRDSNIALPFFYNSRSGYLPLTSVEVRRLGDRAPLKRIQTVGNCMVKNHQIGVQIRLGQERYRWLREEEIKAIPFKNRKSLESKSMNIWCDHFENAPRQMSIRSALMEGEARKDHMLLLMQEIINDPGKNQYFFRKLTQNNLGSIPFGVLVERPEFQRIIQEVAPTYPLEPDLMDSPPYLNILMGNETLAAKKMALREIRFLPIWASERTMVSELVRIVRDFSFPLELKVLASMTLFLRGDFAHLDLAMGEVGNLLNNSEDSSPVYELFEEDKESLNIFLLGRLGLGSGDAYVRFQTTYRIAVLASHPRSMRLLSTNTYDMLVDMMSQDASLLVRVGAAATLLRMFFSRVPESKLASLKEGIVDYFNQCFEELDPPPPALEWSKEYLAAIQIFYQIIVNAQQDTFDCPVEFLRRTSVDLWVNFLGMTLPFDCLFKVAFEAVRSRERRANLFDSPTVLVIGPTGAGKSSTINYLNNVPMEMRKNPWTGDKYFVARESANLSIAAPIGHSTSSATLYPQIFEPNQEGIAFYDTPGFGETRKGMKECSELGLPLAIRFSSNIRGVMILIEWSSLKAERGDRFKNILNILLDIFNDPARLLQEGRSPVLFVFTKAGKKTKEELLSKISGFSQELQRNSSLKQLEVKIRKSTQEIVTLNKHLQNYPDDRPLKEKLAEEQARLKENTRLAAKMKILETILTRSESVFVLSGNEEAQKNSLLQYLTVLCQGGAPSLNEANRFRLFENNIHFGQVQKAVARIAEREERLLALRRDSLEALKSVRESIQAKTNDIENNKQLLESKPVALNFIKVMDRKVGLKLAELDELERRVASNKKRIEAIDVRLNELDRDDPVILGGTKSIDKTRWKWLFGPKHGMSVTHTFKMSTDSRREIIPILEIQATCVINKATKALDWSRCQFVRPETERGIVVHSSRLLTNETDSRPADFARSGEFTRWIRNENHQGEWSITYHSNPGEDVLAAVRMIVRKRDEPTNKKRIQELRVDRNTAIVRGRGYQSQIELLQQEIERLIDSDPEAWKTVGVPDSMQDAIRKRMEERQQELLELENKVVDLEKENQQVKQKLLDRWSWFEMLRILNETVTFPSNAVNAVNPSSTFLSRFLRAFGDLCQEVQFPRISAEQAFSGEIGVKFQQGMSEILRNSRRTGLFGHFSRIETERDAVVAVAAARDRDPRHPPEIGGSGSGLSAEERAQTAAATGNLARGVFGGSGTDVTVRPARQASSRVQQP